MSKITPAELQKHIKELQSRYDSLVAREKKCATFTVTIDENVEAARPKFDILDNFDKLVDLRREIARCKHALSVFNLSTIIPELGLTIDEVLVKLPMLKQEVERLEDYKNRLPRERVEPMRYAPTKTPEYTYINYKLFDIEEIYNMRSDALRTYQLELDKINSTATIDIDLEKI